MHTTQKVKLLWHMYCASAPSILSHRCKLDWDSVSPAFVPEQAKQEVTALTRQVCDHHDGGEPQGNVRWCHHCQCLEPHLAPTRVFRGQGQRPGHQCPSLQPLMYIGDLIAIYVAWQHKIYQCAKTTAVMTLP